MCGIAFVYGTHLSAAQAAQKIVHANAQLSHRGPDDQGVWQTTNVAIGHRRLAIIDLASSRQPMTDPSGRYVLSYNGEIYNFRALRERLSRHWVFKTQGDTEVMLAGLVVHGESFLNDMEGMWAFALWDQSEKRLLLSRDRMGEKPLFYQHLSTGFACASELTALASLTDRWSEDIDSTADYLRYGYYLPGFTAYKNVFEVLPGHSISWHVNENPKHNRYWQIPLAQTSNQTVDEAAQLLREKLVHAVKSRLVADVDVGAFLSGGVDSSLVVSIMHHELNIRPQTFTIGFPERSFDEREYAREIANLCGTQHHEQVLTDLHSELLEQLISKHVGQPFTDSSLLPTAMLSKLTASRVKVSLSGDGGDELFSGYQRYQARTLLQWYTRLPRLLRNNVERLIRGLPEPISHHSHSLLKKAHLFYDVLERQKMETPYVAPVFYSKENFAALAPDLVNRGHRPPALPEQARSDSILEMMYADALVYLPQDILVKVDRATMAYSLEARAPFLDKNVVELAFSLPGPWHRNAFVGKKLLKRAFSDLLPKNIWARRKQGFGVPIHNWFRGQLGQNLEKSLEHAPAFIDKDFVRQMLNVHRIGRRDHGYRLWSLYVYLIWQKRSLWQSS